MTEVYVVNSFSIGMLKETVRKFTVDMRELSIEEAKQLLNSTSYKSYIGHESTALLLSQLLQLPIPYNRERLVLSNKYNILLLVQVRTRLEEGKVLTFNEILDLFKKGLIKLYRLDVTILED